MRAADFVSSYSLMMASGLLLGIALGGFPAYTREISMAALAIVMTISLSNIRLAETMDKAHGKDAVFSIVLNYGMLTGIILVLGSFFSEDLWWGWVLMAAAPSAISIVPFTGILGGRASKALFSTTVNYLSALALMPAISLALIGSAVSVDSLVTSLLLLIVLPMVLSRGVGRMGISRQRLTMSMNVFFAILIFAVAGANRDAFLGEPGLIIAISAVGMIRTFGVGLGTEYSLRALGIPKEERVSSVLFSSYKNLGLTATLAIALFDPIVAVPATICIVFEVVWVIFLLKFYPGVSK